MEDLTLRLVDSTSGPLVAVARELFAEYQESVGVDLCFQGFAKEMAELPGAYVPPSGRLYVGWVASAPACCVALRRHDSTRAELKRLYVRPAYRGRGFARVLAARILVDAVEIGYGGIVLDTLPTMVAAQRMYEDLGFTDILPYVHNPITGTRFMELTLPKAPGIEPC